MQSGWEGLQFKMHQKKIHNHIFNLPIFKNIKPGFCTHVKEIPKQTYNNHEHHNPLCAATTKSAIASRSHSNCSKFKIKNAIFGWVTAPRRCHQGRTYLSAISLKKKIIKNKSDHETIMLSHALGSPGILSVNKIINLY